MEESSSPEAVISSVNPAASEARAPRAVPVPALPAAEIVVVARERTAEIHAHIDEFAADVAGSLSPFGDDIEFPLPLERLGYRHPGPANRPALAGD
jgi:succinate dehydrogenase / fumarate reductase iron-sulfur subunit